MLARGKALGRCLSPIIRGFSSTSSVLLAQKGAYDVVICGAGIAGVATAFYLNRLRLPSDPPLKIAVVDPRPPLSFTSSMSTECYRNFWVKPEVFRFMERSIDLMEDLALESDNTFHMTRKGYVYLASTDAGVEELRRMALQVSSHQTDPLRVFQGPNPRSQGYIAEADFDSYLKARGAAGPGLERDQYPFRGIDILEGNEAVRAVFPYVGKDIKAALHARRCGWLSAQQFGMHMWERCREQGVEFISGSVTQVLQTAGRVTGAAVSLTANGQVSHLRCHSFVNSAGPFVQGIHSLLQSELPAANRRPLPISNELHGKVIFKDTKEVVPQSAPMVICAENTHLHWSPEEHEELEASDFPLKNEWLGELPSGLHFRPFGNKTLAILWEYVHMETPVSDPPHPEPQFDPLYPEIVTRGLATVIPSFREYIGSSAKNLFIDGGYHCKTRDNLPIIDSYSSPKGAYICGALSGFGIMSSCAAAEITALRFHQRALPAYAKSFEIEVHNRAEEEALQSGIKGSRHKEVQL